MSNNAPDYDNLAFEPTSADDLNEQGRQSDVLISAIERCEKLENQLRMMKKAIKTDNVFLATFFKIVKEQISSELFEEICSKAKEECNK